MLERDFGEGVFVRRPANLAKELVGRVAQKVSLLLDKAKAMEWERRAGLAVAATEVYAIRLGVIVCALPVFLLAGLVAVVDGLGHRDLRRFGGGRERGMVFPAFTLPWILYLSWPDTVHPAHFILPFAAAFGWALWIAAASFKIYL